MAIDNGMYTLFLNFKEAQINLGQKKLDYDAFKMSDFNLPIILVNFCIAILVAIVLYPVADGVLKKNPHRFLYLGFFFATLLCVAVIILNRLILLSYEYNIRILQKFYQHSTTFVKSKYWHLIDDSLIILGSISAGLFFFVHLLEETYDCPHSNLIFSCKDSLAGHTLPPSAESIFRLILNMIIVLFFQSLTNCSRFSIVLAWIIRCVFTSHHDT
jgi:hypothetical protein